MKLSIYGSGYVGLVSAVCFAKLGHQVLCVDLDAEKVARLQAGDCPIYEQDLPELLQAELASGRLCFSNDIAAAAKFAELHFIATGTPSLPNGEADLSQVFAAGFAIMQAATDTISIVIKSTVPPGTGSRLEKALRLEFPERSVHLLSNPEFLCEGTAVSDFMRAARIIVGGEALALEPLLKVYAPLAASGIPIQAMSRSSAELCKYASNTFLAAKVSFMNQISRLAEKLAADVEEIAAGMALDPRIGPHYLRAGIGYGGSCFPKDNRAFIQLANEQDEDPAFFTAVEAINRRQKGWPMDKLQQHFAKDLADKVIGIWGLAFKPGTDDIREAPSLELIRDLLAAGARLRVYDPAAMPALQAKQFQGAIDYAATPAAVWQEPLDALLILTEWPCFRNFDLAQLAAALGDCPVFDGRNCYSLDQVAAARLTYYSVGRAALYKGELVAHAD